ncbi:MAG: aldehyde dehydrogenase family protein [Nitrospinae bacterium]|nr:aldehyde dehydrogenase family protein [Nitrospinota bacterium]
MKAPRKILIGGEWIATKQSFEVFNPYTGKIAGHVCQAGKKEVDTAIKAATKAFAQTRSMGSGKVAALLKRAVHGLIRRKKELVDTIVAEAGKPVTLAGQEVDRTIITFTIAAEEATRCDGELIPADVDPRGEGRYCIVKRFPVGVVAGISPFNFPLNLVAHKVAPAIASRNTIVLKPSSKTPMTALLLGEILTEAGIVPGQYNVVPCNRQTGEILATDERIAKVTFTGSPPVGWRLKEICGRKRITLELGGNAAAVVMDDADIPWAVSRIVAGAYGYAGQVCISVQRILIHRKIYAKTVRALIAEIKRSAKVGDPKRPDVMVGPMIDGAALLKTAEWVKEAVAGGAKVLTGGRRRGPCYEPTLLANVTRTMKVVCREAFAPVAVVQPFGTFDQAMNLVNDSDFGLQMGIFTKNMASAFGAFERAEVGGVIVNDFPTFRVDNMPYGGVKMSGFGREGIKYAMEEMTERKVMVIRP